MATKKSALEMLNEKVRELRDLSGQIGVRRWRQGRVLESIVKLELWKWAVDANGRRYARFNDWCKAVLRMRASYCYDIIGTAMAFTEDQVRELSFSTLMRVLRCPEVERPALLDRIRDQKLGRRAVEVIVRQYAVRCVEGRSNVRRAVEATRQRRTYRHLVVRGFMLDHVQPLSDGDGVEIILKRMTPIESKRQAAWFARGRKVA
jgi:hypothetical protein